MCSIIGVGERLHKVLGQIDLAHWTQVSDRCPLGYLFAHFYQELWGLEGWNLVHTWTVGGCMMYTRIRLLLLIRSFIFSFSNIQILKFSSHFSQELWGLENWNLVHTWTMGGCIVSTRIRQLLLHMCSFIFSFFFLSSFQTLKCFCHTFHRNYEA